MATTAARERREERIDNTATNDRCGLKAPRWKVCPSPPREEQPEEEEEEEGEEGEEGNTNESSFAKSWKLSFKWKMDDLVWAQTCSCWGTKD